MIRWSDTSPLTLAIPERRYVFQLDAIPTVGFSDPILSYFSAIRYIFDDIRMLKDGYEKVIALSIHAFLVSNR